jgi:hypothetical protein
MREISPNTFNFSSSQHPPHDVFVKQLGQSKYRSRQRERSHSHRARSSPRGRYSRMDLRTWGFYLPILYFRFSKCVSVSKSVTKITISKSNYIKQTGLVSSKHTTNRIHCACIAPPISHGYLLSNYA